MKKIPVRPATKAKQAKVFIVDDHPIVRRGLAQLINQEADLVVCGEAETIQATLDQWEKSAPDVALVDLSLKAESGLELIKDIKVRYPAVPVLVLSMHDETFYAERAIRAGAEGYIMKQQASDLVLAAIRRVLGGEIYLSEPMAAKILRRASGEQPDQLPSPMERLSDRELEVFRLIGTGLGTRKIAEQLSRSVKTVETYREHIKEKLDLKGASELTQAAFQWLQSQNMK
ncbi:MAG: DNA-binding response regulator [Candidatus Lindowbacteria bacterium RIFCSPLOWO2_12_FULL_62_27]|nr:MAG: DNA-binding response regulator [Candidatus Lindowbacteria bacterium RIFCSPLOWO2_12_FULL_62_27]OGH61924.1 MAG: DNA-binding response regulator [Candidatus Lindowbacteria bacterium RIFCSPLOWO2_02_FULL_62_12]